MEVGSSVSSYISSISTAYKQTYSKASKVDSQISISYEESKMNDPIAYYKQWCSEYPDISFRLTDYENGTNAKGYNLGYNNSMNQVGNNFGELYQYSVEIDISVIRKMMSDSTFESNTKNYFQSLIEQVYPQFQATAVSDGMSNMCMNIGLDGDRLDFGATYTHCHFSTEEEVRKMWADEEYQKTIGQIFDKQKADLIDIYLKMTENCVLKMKELASSEFLKEEPTEDISAGISELDEKKRTSAHLYGAIEEINPDSIGESLKSIGFMTYSLSEGKNTKVVAYVAEESTEENPIILCRWKDQDGNVKACKVDLNKVNPLAANDMEMFAYLTYEQEKGNWISGAINNFEAYRNLREMQDESYHFNNTRGNGEYYLLSCQNNVNEMMDTILSWMKDIQHPDAKKYCNQISSFLEMFNPTSGYSYDETL